MKMENTEMKTPKATDKIKDAKSSGKKLVQARLPFKILPSSPLDGSESLDKKDKSPVASTPSNKRKLSYSESEAIGIKENEGKSNEVTEILVLDDSDPEVRTPVAKASGSGCKLKIKLPSSKKKRRSKNLIESKKNDDDVEIVEVAQQENISEAEILDSGNKVTLDGSQLKEGDVEENELRSSVETIEISQGENPQKMKSKKTEESTNESKSQNSDTPKTRKRGKSKSKSPPKSGILPVEKELEIEDKSPQSPVTKKAKMSSPCMANKDEDLNKTKENSGEENTSMLRQSLQVSIGSKETDTKHKAIEIKSDDEEEKEKVSKHEGDKETKTPVGKRASARISLGGQSKATPTSYKNQESTPNSGKKSEERKQLLKEQREKKMHEDKLQKQKEREEKEAQRKKEKEEKEAERKREKVEKEEQRKREKEEKEAERKREKEEKEEQRKKEKEEKEEQRKKEKEEKDEIKKKEKEKKIAEQEARNEEKRKKEEEERRKKEEVENKKKKAAEAFTKFFVKHQTSASKKDSTDDKPDDARNDAPLLAFKPFQLRADMKLAPTVRRCLGTVDKTKLESVIETNNEDISRSNLYLEEIKSGRHIAHKELRHIRDEEDDDCIVVEDDELGGAGEKIEEAKKKWYRSKYFSFIENRRPPFYGTWRKTSRVIGPRTPFGKDAVYFDYEIDSDDEWEEEEPGESLHGSDDEKDKESEDDDYDIDNKWLVPHGHLSDEELGEEIEDTSREAQKAKLVVLQQEFDQKMKKKTEKLKPRLIGVIWADENGNKPNSCPDVIWESLCKRAMVFSEIPPFEEPKEEVVKSDDTSISSSPPPQRLEFNEELIRDLTRLVYHNNNSKQFLVNEFIAYSCKKYEIDDAESLGLRKSKVKEKIDEFAEWGSIEELGPNKKKKKFLCWVVKPEHIEKYMLSELKDKNNWEYILEPKQRIEKKVSTPTTKPLKMLSDDKIKTKSPTNASSKKRVNILMSVPRGQPIPQQSKNALISKFLQNNLNKISAGTETTDMDDELEDDVILLDD